MMKLKQYIILFFIMIIFLLPIYAALIFNDINERMNTISTSLAYLEDRSGTLAIEQIDATETPAAFRLSESEFLTFGSSRSVWWVRVDGRFSNQESDDLLISVNNPSIQSITAYIPTIDEEHSYIVKHCGWDYNAGSDSVPLQSPVFELPEHFDKEGYIYLRIQSVYPHNYDVRILSENQFNSFRQQNLTFIGVLLGTFITMAVLNSTIYLFLREITYLYYAVYEIAMFVFQAVSMGVTNLLPYRFASVMAINQGLFSCLMLMSSLSFVQSFLLTEKNMPKHNVILNILKVTFLINIIIMFAGWRFEANIVTDYFGYAVSALTLSVAVLSVRKKVSQAKYFLTAWILLILGGVVFILRNSGLLNNQFLVAHFMLLAATGESLLIFMALVDRAKVIMDEKYQAMKLLQEAEVRRKKAEISFLRAQIKPHFLYNTLSIIAALTEKNPSRAKELLYHLSDYLRGSFHFENENGMATLSQELETVKAYLTIEKERFRNKLAVDYEIDKSVMVSLPPLTIQPLVENALRHGIFKKPEGGHVKIIVKRLPDLILIQVQDDGVGIPEEKLDCILNQTNETTGVGLRNINERLMLHYGHGLEIDSKTGVGTSVTIKIPAKEGAEQ